MTYTPDKGTKEYKIMLEQFKVIMKDMENLTPGSSYYTEAEDDLRATMVEYKISNLFNLIQKLEEAKINDTKLNSIKVQPIANVKPTYNKLRKDFIVCMSALYDKEKKIENLEASKNSQEDKAKKDLDLEINKLKQEVKADVEIINNIRKDLQNSSDYKNDKDIKEICAEYDKNSDFIIPLNTKPINILASSTESRSNKIREAKTQSIEDVYNKLYEIAENLNNAITKASEVATAAELFGGQISQVLTAQMRNYFMPAIAKYISDDKTPGAIAINIKFLDSVPLSMTRSAIGVPGAPVANPTSATLEQTPALPQAVIPQAAPTKTVEKVSKILKNKKISLLEMTQKTVDEVIRK